MTEKDDVYHRVLTMFRTNDWSSYSTDMSNFCVYVQRHPQTIIDLARTVLDELPQGGTFLDIALSFLPMEHWPDVVQVAVTSFLQNASNQAAQSILIQASLQCPKAVHFQCT